MLWGLDIVHVCILIVIIAGLVAIVYIALNKLGVGIPEWVKQVFWVVVVVFICVIAIKVIAGLL